MKAENKNNCEENSLEKLEGLDGVSRTGKQLFQKIIRSGGTGGGKKQKQCLQKDKKNLSDANNNAKLLVEWNDHSSDNMGWY